MGGGNFHKSVTKKVVANFVKNNLICHFSVSEPIFIDNGANLNSYLMKEICEQFKVTHRNFTAYRPPMNRAIKAANKNIKRTLRKMVNKYKNWHEQLSYALLGYKMTTRISTGATPYLLVYGTEAVIPAEVEIPSLRVIQEAELKDAEWVRNHYEQSRRDRGKEDGGDARCTRQNETPPTRLFTKKDGRQNSSQREMDQKGHDKMGNKDTPDRKSHRANE
ncbi:uncharacterized protein LOC132044302, partial [Lycium ferocissimum]|uniref:uncharacterized protein LOC132044302 n=1 Tax=Lycium ferocissimum TaxID=112874 RepID=UPI002815091F